MSAVNERVSSINRAAIDRGYRFGLVGEDCRWCHRLELPEGFIDLTDMDDAEFADFLSARNARLQSDSDISPMTPEQQAEQAQVRG